MDFMHAVILGIIEGITEFLPVSSTGHMILGAHLMHLPDIEFIKTFEIAIQLGAIAAVFSLYWRTFLLDWEVTLKVLTAFVPTALVGFFLYKVVKHFLMGNVLVVIAALFVGGVILVIFEKWHKPSPTHVVALEKITYTQALFIGLCQSLAVIPGVSRSAASIIGGLMLGISRKAIVEFSFLLALPTIAAAVTLDIAKTHVDVQVREWALLAVGFVVAFLVAWASVKFLLKFIKSHDFVIFGIYRIVLAVVLFIFYYCNLIK